MVRWFLVGLLVLALLVLGCTSAHSQMVEEDFLSGGLSSPWGWEVSGNAPQNPLDSSRVQFTGEWLRVTLQPGTLFQGFNSVRNLPSIPVPALRADWRIETRVRLVRNGASGSYVQAGLKLFRDADNYFNLHLVIDPSTGNYYVSTGVEQGGQYQFAGLLSPNSWSPSQTDTVRLLIRQREPNGVIEFYYDLEDRQGWRALSGSPVAPSAFPILQQIVQNGGFVGLYADTAGWSGSNPPVAWFDYLIVVGAPLEGDVNGDGCVDDADLLAVLFAFGSTGCNLDTDVNRDGVVDDADLLTVLFAFGSGC